MVLLRRFPALAFCFLVFPYGRQRKGKDRFGTKRYQMGLCYGEEGKNESKTPKRICSAVGKGRRQCAKGTVGALAGGSGPGASCRGHYGGLLRGWGKICRTSLELRQHRPAALSARFGRNPGDGASLGRGARQTDDGRFSGTDFYRLC